MLDKIEASCCGIGFRQCHVIIEVGRAGCVSLNDLAGLLGLDKSTLSRITDNLVRQGLAVREPDTEDRRYIKIRLTESGEKCFLILNSEWKSTIKRFTVHCHQRRGIRFWRALSCS